MGEPVDRSPNAGSHGRVATLGRLLALGDRALGVVRGATGVGAGPRLVSGPVDRARALVLLPLVVPPVVGGVGLFYAFGLNGLVGQYLYDWFGIQVTYSTAAVVMAETFVAMPFVVITVEAALRSMDGRFEDAAATLGAKPLTVARRVTLPMILPGLIAGVALAWARALGEFGATITFAGNIQGRTQTTPLAVYALLQGPNPDVAIGLSIVLLAVCVAVLALLRDRWLGVG